MPGVKGQRSGGQNAKTLRQHRLEGTIKKHRHSGYENADPPLGNPPTEAGRVVGVGVGGVGSDDGAAADVEDAGRG